MQNIVIRTDDTGKELNEHGKPWFPIAAYDEYFSKFILKEVPWHWHPEVELVIVKEGATRVYVLGQTLDLFPGQCIFINSNVLHRFTQIGPVDCHIINFVFKPEFIGGKKDSQIYQNYIRPLCDHATIRTIQLRQDTPIEKEAIKIMHDAFITFTKADFGYELLVRNQLSQLWFQLFNYVSANDQSSSTSSIYDDRLESIIKFIHKHISKKLTVKLIGQAALISESECYRLFKSKLNLTPMAYVLQHRLQLAATMLMETQDSIVNIAMEVGFTSPSYFSKQFKIQYSITPKAFRNRPL